MAPVLCVRAGTDINRHIRAARKYVGPQSNLGTIKIVFRRGNLMDLGEITRKTNRGKLYYNEVHNM
jgi:hypothetical protein